MEQVAPIDPGAFVCAVEPLLERQDLTGLLTLLKTRWTPEQLRALLRGSHTDAKKVALLALGLVAPACCIPDLCLQLQDPDPIIYELAEHALWSIWFRGGDPAANHELARGAQALGRKDLDHAIKHFTKAIESSPDFSEAYNQRAIAHYLLEDYRASIQDCRRAIDRMPQHFGALSGMGHCYAHLGDAERAIESYQRALAIHPHLDCVRQAIEQLRRGLEDRAQQ